VRLTAVVAIASFIVVLALTGCVQMTVAPSPAAAPVAVAPPTLDLASLETRLRAAGAIGVFTKLSLKNLRQEYDLLLLKALSLLQDNDASLARAISASRESIWGILVDPAKLAKLG